MGKNIQESKEYFELEENIKADMNKYNYISSSAWDLTLYVEDIVSHISGYVVKVLKKYITCAKCQELLQVENTFSKLQKRKRYGVLTNAS